MDRVERLLDDDAFEAAEARLDHLFDGHPMSFVVSNSSGACAAPF